MTELSELRSLVGELADALDVALRVIRSGMLNTPEAEAAWIKGSKYGLLWRAEKARKPE